MAINLNSISYLQPKTLKTTKDIETNGNSNNSTKPSTLAEDDYIIKLDNLSFDRVQTKKIEVAKFKSGNDYMHILDERVSVDDVRENGIGGETQKLYDVIIYGDWTGIRYNSGKTFEEKLQSTAEKYDILAKK